MKTASQVLQDKGHQIISIRPDRSVYDALHVLAEHKIGALLVFEHDQLVGIFSERDYAREVVLQGRDAKTTAVADLMTQNVVTVTPCQPIDECMKIMSDMRIRHLPVVEGARVLEGMLGLVLLVFKCDAWLTKVKSILLVSKSTRATFTVSLSPSLNRAPVRSPTIS